MRILHVVHGHPPAAMGGTEIYAQALAQAMARASGDELFLLARDNAPDRPELSLRQEAHEGRDGVQLLLLNNTFRGHRGFEDTYRHRGLGKRLGVVLDELRPDVVHIHHLTNLSTDLLLQLRARRIATLFTLHDYWLFCQRGQLLDLSLERCAGPSIARCARCLGLSASAPPLAQRLSGLYRSIERSLPSAAARPLRRLAERSLRFTSRPRAGEAAVARRQAHLREAMQAVTLYLAPSQALLERFVAQGVPRERIRLVELGIELTPFERLTRTPSTRLRLGFLGTLMVSKAPHLLLEAHAGLPKGAAKVSLFGSYAPYHGDDSYRAKLEPLLKTADIAHLGPVPRNELVRRLGELDVLVVPSTWEENSPVVIREAFAAGLPVVAAALGGIPEQVHHEKNGLLFRPGDADDLRRCLQRLLDEPGLLDHLRRGLPHVRSIEENARMTRALYDEAAATA